MFFAFYMILPAMPVYLLLEFNASKSLIGLILSSYTIATLIIRPFSGFFADTLPRKPLYMLAFFLFVGNFAGYLFATSLLLITIIRITHGLTYGVVTTASSTLAIDVMPSSRRGEGIGYFGATSTMAMALGPMVGLFFAESHSFNIVFGISIAFGIIGLILASFIKVGKRPPISKAPISLDRFLLLKATTPAIVLILFAFLYGHLITYIALFGKEVGINSGTGLFFTLYSIGLIASRFNSGKFIDKGYITQLILIGNAMIVVSFTIFVLADNVYLFYGIAAFIGLGFGISSPAYQTLFLNLAENNQRGTANSTYLMSWDIGTGLGVLIGGYVAEWSSYHTAYGIAIILAIMSIVLFWKVSIPYFNKHRLK
jgi:MFS family permease